VRCLVFGCDVRLAARGVSDDTALSLPRRPPPPPPPPPPVAMQHTHNPLHATPLLLIGNKTSAATPCRHQCARRPRLVSASLLLVVVVRRWCRPRERRRSSCAFHLNVVASMPSRHESQPPRVPVLHCVSSHIIYTLSTCVDDALATLCRSSPAATAPGRRLLVKRTQPPSYQHQQHNQPHTRPHINRARCTHLFSSLLLANTIS
jgi:hypothetical protein